MDDPNITMEEYIRLEEEKARRRAIAVNDTLTSEATLLCEPTDLVKEISTNISGEFTNLEILKCWSLETSRRLFNTNYCY
ncbi:hypothetical protein Tco_1380987 [Tanacetum coccineum]